MERIEEVFLARYRATLYPISKWGQSIGLTCSIKKLKKPITCDYKSFHFKLDITGFTSYTDSRIDELNNVKGFRWVKQGDKDIAYAQEENDARKVA